MKTFDTNTIENLYKAVFSYIGPPFPASFSLKGLPILETLGITKPDQPYIGYLDMEIDGISAWRLPIEPLIQIKGGHKIIQRYPQQTQTSGSYKEYWQSQDYTLSIKGVLISDDHKQPPTEDLQKLHTYLTNVSLKLYNPLLNALNISQVVVQNFDFPHTPGPANQAYTFTCLSDTEDYSLLDSDTA